MGYSGGSQATNRNKRQELRTMSFFMGINRVNGVDRLGGIGG